MIGRPSLTYTCEGCKYLWSGRWCIKNGGIEIFYFKTPEKCPYPHDLLKVIRKTKLEKLEEIF